MCFAKVDIVMKVPRLLDIFAPSTVRKPWVKIPDGFLKPAPWSIDGQNKA